MRGIKLCSGISALSLIFSAGARAEITVLDKNPNSNLLLAPLSLTVGGSIRPEWISNAGPEPGYYRRGHDGGTRFRFGGDYALTPQTSAIVHYEWGVDLPHVLSWGGHYDESSRREWQRKFYGGVRDERFGTLTYGHQFGIYYSVVGSKSDMWDNDGLAGGTANGISGDYDGANRPKRSFMYTNTFGPVKLYANYLLPEDGLHMADGNTYRRRRGGGFGFDYSATKTLMLSAAYSYTDAVMEDRARSQKKSYRQQLSGLAATWQPDNWYIVGTASYYKDFVPDTRGKNLSHYFAGSGYGLEGYVGYTFRLGKPFLNSIQPYVAEDSLQLRSSNPYHATHTYLGTNIDFGHGVSVTLEQTLSARGSNEPNSTWMTWYYNF